MPPVNAAFANRRPSNQRHLTPVKRPDGRFIGPSLIAVADETNRAGRPILTGMIGQHKPLRQRNIHEIWLPGRFQAHAAWYGTGAPHHHEHQRAGNEPQPEFSAFLINRAPVNAVEQSGRSYAAEPTTHNSTVSLPSGFVNVYRRHGRPIGRQRNEIAANAGEPPPCTRT